MGVISYKKLSSGIAGKIDKKIRRGKIDEAMEMIDYHRERIREHIKLLKPMKEGNLERQEEEVRASLRRIQRLKEKKSLFSAGRKDRKKAVEDLKKEKLELEKKQTGLILLNRLHAGKWSLAERNAFVEKKKRMLKVLDNLARKAKLYEKHKTEKSMANKKLMKSDVNVFRRRSILK